MQRRLHMVPFAVTIAPEKRDGELMTKLLHEADDILAWAVEGCRRWQQEGLALPKALLVAQGNYFTSEAVIVRWIGERCELAHNKVCGVSKLYEDWCLWAEQQEVHIGSLKAFSAVMGRQGFERCRIEDGLRGLIGIGLKAQ